VFADRSAHRLELLNDSIVLFCAIHALVFLSMDVTNVEAREAAAISLSLLILANLGIMTLKSFGMICKNLKVKMQKMIARHRLRAEMMERLQPKKCTCKCYTCGQEAMSKDFK